MAGGIMTPGGPRRPLDRGANTGLLPRRDKRRKRSITKQMRA
jgi:hypothetical protein